MSILEDFEYRHQHCYQCLGFYGPNFNQPTCGTCHAFLYPDDVSQQPSVGPYQEKTDDGDSGNEEPKDHTELYQMQLAAQENTGRAPGCRASGSYGENQEVAGPSRRGAMRDVGGSNHWGSGVVRDALQERLNMLTIPRLEADLDPNFIDTIPPEVLMLVFRLLDDMTLWCVGRVCRRWQQLLQSCTTDEDWHIYTRKRWPLFRPLYRVDYWEPIYTKLTESAPCQLCLHQMSLHTRTPANENAWRRNRLKSELRTLKTDPPEGIEAIPLDQMSQHWQASIRGPAGSPYEGGTFYLYIQIPPSYPLCPPVVRFITKIFHPNVSRHGDIGIDSIQHNWSLALTLSKVLISIQSLLTDPYIKVCMEPWIGDLYSRDKSQFEKIARCWTWSSAMHDALIPDPPPSVPRVPFSCAPSSHSQTGNGESASSQATDIESHMEMESVTLASS
ncbi:modifier of rpr and grim, ubiquitously expressed [Oratosquilla oratoria]|uniref:modifier of rpr and grim, ubiquitously expressed n=1 Tax=Oratosquilla oratoria TaxID=337810 RepID=UPI003F75B50E